jgi:hypothetical protein
MTRKREDRGRLPEGHGDMLLVIRSQTTGKFFDPDARGFTSDAALRIFIFRNDEDAATIKAEDAVVMLA